MPERHRVSNAAYRRVRGAVFGLALLVGAGVTGCDVLGVGSPLASLDDAAVIGSPDDPSEPVPPDDPVDPVGDDPVPVPDPPAPTDFSVTYNINGGTGTIPEDTTVYKTGDTVTVLAADSLFIDDVVDRYFVYWNTRADGSGAVYVPNDTNYDTSFTVGAGDVTLYAIYIGDRTPSGGWIYYDDQDAGMTDIADGRFIEIAAADQSNGTPWSDVTDEMVGTLADFGTGPANTSAIIAQIGHTNSAAQLCRSLGPEWFLPSGSESGFIYDNLHRNGLGDLSETGSYWVSTEVQATTAAYGDMATGTAGQDFKYSSHRVRAVRFF